MNKPQTGQVARATELQPVVHREPANSIKHALSTFQTKAGEPPKAGAASHGVWGRRPTGGHCHRKHLDVIYDSDKVWS